jgi:hypothetical protein
MIDWQTLVVVLIILAALFYVARRVFVRLCSMNSKETSCETGCGKCESNSTTHKNKKSLVQISPSITGKK